MRFAAAPGALLLVSLLGGCALPPRPAVQPAPSHDTASRPSAAESRAPQARIPAEEVPLSFDRGLWHLEGSLSLPERAEGEKVPAVVIVHGSGPMSRDGLMRGQIGLGFGFELPVYKRLAEALAARGYAVYRYDKRSCGRWNDCADHGPSALPYSLVEAELSTGELVGDAEAALDAVALRPEIDSARTFFVGHSEGGELVPQLLSERREVRAGVMLAPPFNTMGVVLEQQSERVRWAFAAAGKEALGETQGKELEEAALGLREIERGTHFGQPILGQPAGLWASWIDAARRAPDIARALDRPLLVLGGSYDYNVAASEIESWARWLGASPRAPHRVRVIACVTHALNCVSQGEPARITPGDIGHDLSPELVGEVARFLDANASPR